MLTYKTILTKLEENTATIKKFGVKKIGLFGSYLKKEQKAPMDLEFFLEDLLKCKVDLVMKEAIKPDLKPYILGSVKYAAGV